MTKNASSAGGKSADACRTERVANTNALLQSAYRLAAHADAQEWDKAREEGDQLHKAGLAVVRSLGEEAAASGQG
jgi:hypothetical protein